MKNLILVIVFSLITFDVIAKDCEFGNIKFDSDFPVARLNDCDRKSSREYLLTVEAENYPVNPSPWYAFKVSAKKPQTIGITIDFVKGKSRYLPKISTDGKSWTQIPYKVKQGKLKFKIRATKEPLWVAGQEIIDNDFYQTWLEAVAKATNSKFSELGRSTLDLPIYQLESTNESNEWVVILGRMHPPEITGALALFPFVQKLLLDESIGTKFRERFNVLVIPNMNPDGVEAGNWRHNSNGVDLNRDWKTRKQKETQLVHEKIQSITQNGGKVVYAIDFHSTSKDVFYAMPNDYGAKPATMTEDWLALLDAKTPGFEVLIQPGDNPNRGVFKQYVADVYGVHAITYEMDDNADRGKIKEIANIAAETLMESLLSKAKGEFE